MNRNRLIAIGAVAAVLILLAVISAARRGNGPQAPQVAENQVHVLVAAKDIPPNTVITDDMVDKTSKVVPQSQFDKDYATALTELKKFVSGTATTAIAKGSPFTAANTKPAPEFVSQKIQAGYVGVTLAAPEKPSLYDLKFLIPDDRVDVVGVTFDAQGNWSTSTPLASNVRVLAVDSVMDIYKERARQADLDKKIDDLNTKRANAVPAMTPEQSKATDDQIAALKLEKDPKIEHPSVTVEVTPQQAQVLALWRTASTNATLKIALHRQPDATSAVFAEEQMVTTGAPGAPGAPGMAGATPAMAGGLGLAGAVHPNGLLTMDDVVPLQLRDPKQYGEMLDLQDKIADHNQQREVTRVENDLRISQARTRISNLGRYGSETPPAPKLTGGMGGAPPMPPATVGPMGPAPKLASGTSGGGTHPSPPAAYAPSVEVVKGTTKTIMSGS
jgi:Flp pilus assembly protein CpaB